MGVASPVGVERPVGVANPVGSERDIIGMMLGLVGLAKEEKLGIEELWAFGVTNGS